MKTWIVVVNRREAKFFAYFNHRSSDVKFQTKLENPRGRLKAQDIDADKPGIFSSIMSHGTKLVKQQSPTERVAEEFAKTVAEFIEESRQKKFFDNLILVADPAFLGNLRQLLSKGSKELVVREVPKVFSPEITESDLKQRLFPEEEAPDYVNFL